LSKDVSYSNEIIDKQKEIERLRKRILSLQLLSEDEDISVVYPLSSIRESIEKIGGYAADIAELTIDRTYKEGASKVPREKSHL
ncbi:MAG: PhoU domain-containing protein, partial [Candidatus Bipolaricaulia bacterium]